MYDYQRRTTGRAIVRLRGKWLWGSRAVGWSLRGCCSFKGRTIQMGRRDASVWWRWLGVWLYLNLRSLPNFSIATLPLLWARSVNWQHFCLLRWIQIQIRPKFKIEGSIVAQSSRAPLLRHKTDPQSSSILPGSHPLQFAAAQLTGHDY
jgi:hypothetical protein